MKAVILCGGRGTRLREETEFKPKPLVEIGDMPIIWHIMKIYSHYGINEFVLCLGYKGHMIKQFFLDFDNYKSDFTLNLKTKKTRYHNHKDVEDWSITFAETGFDTNTGARIKKIEKYINEDNFFMTYGDGVANIDIKKLVEYHKSHGKIGTVTAVRPLSRYGVLEIKDNLVTDFTKRNLVHDGRIDGGFYIFKKDIFKYLSNDKNCVLEAEPLQKLSSDKQFMAYRHDGFWQCMDTIQQADMLNEMWNKKQSPWKIWQD